MKFLLNSLSFTVAFIILLFPSFSYSWSCYKNCELCFTEYTACYNLPVNPASTGVVVESGVIKQTKTHKEACERQKIECQKTCGKNCYDFDRRE